MSISPLTSLSSSDTKIEQCLIIFPTSYNSRRTDSSLMPGRLGMSDVHASYVQPFQYQKSHCRELTGETA
jgi:hypothetical protein